MRSRYPLFAIAALLAAAGPGLQAAHGAGQTLASGTQVSYYPITRAEAPITVDGSLEEYPWQRAEQINGFDRILNDYDPVNHPTRAKMLWDDENLYIGFACPDPDIWAIYRNEDDALWEEEVVEAFIDPDGDGRDYLELEVNPLNAVVDLKIFELLPAWRSDIDWDIAGLKTAVKVMGTVNDSLAVDQGWTVEIAIPWSAMTSGIGGGGRPSPGDSWRLNLYRIERQAGRDLKARIDALQAQAGPLFRQQAELLAAQGVKEPEQLRGKARRQYDDLAAQLKPLEAQLKPMNERFNDETEYTAWSETFQRGFHHPARFGVVQFVK
ncbi:MAG: carbohydrate-binding family 9-like protein [Candidatus Latescibacterota bacterium]|jgi:hypothetical protein